MKRDVSKTGILRLTFDEPPVNALKLETLEKLDAALASQNRDGVRGVVLSGLNNAFCAGLHTEVFERDQTRDAVKLLRSIVRQLVMTDAPMAAGISGGCIGAGMVFALACDYRVVSAKSRFAMPEVSLGVPLSAQVYDLVRHWAGAGLARDVCMSGITLTGPSAMQAGLVDRLAYPDACAPQAEAWVARMLNQPVHAMQATYLNMRREIRAIYSIPPSD